LSEISDFLSFLPLQICVNPRLSAAKKSFPFFYFFISPAFFVFLISMGIPFTHVLAICRK